MKAVEVRPLLQDFRASLDVDGLEFVEVVDVVVAA